jgi:hypothetical protein
MEWDSMLSSLAIQKMVSDDSCYNFFFFSFFYSIPSFVCMSFIAFFGKLITDKSKDKEKDASDKADTEMKDIDDKDDVSFVDGSFHFIHSFILINFVFFFFFMQK